jgi:hypothetical protein
VLTEGNGNDILLNPTKPQNKLGIGMIASMKETTQKGSKFKPSLG